MKITQYSFSDKNEVYSNIQFGSVNLIVGSTGSGKSRFLESMFKLARFVASGKEATVGRWDCKISVNERLFDYSLEIVRADLAVVVSYELLIEKFPDGQTVELLRRDGDAALFKSTPLPKLNPSNSLLNLMGEELILAPLMQGFRRMRRRNFSGHDNEKMRALQAIPADLLARFQRTKIYDDGIIGEFALGGMLLVMKRCFPEKYRKIVEAFKDVFPQVQEIVELAPGSITGLPNDPNLIILGIKEKWTKDPIPLPHISSGMLKVLLIITDLETIPDDAIYLIDEYENSLGVNAIDFFPDLMIQHQDRIQFFLTSHHPYLINKIPLENWYIFARQGREVKVKFGPELKDRYGQSKQQAFIQLINDPFYREGIN